MGGMEYNVHHPRCTATDCRGECGGPTVLTGTATPAYWPELGSIVRLPPTRAERLAHNRAQFARRMGPRRVRQAAGKVPSA